MIILNLWIFQNLSNVEDGIEMYVVINFLFKQPFLISVVEMNETGLLMVKDNRYWNINFNNLSINFRDFFYKTLSSY